MTKTDLAAARNLMMAAAATDTASKRDAVALFIAKIDAQIELAKTAAANKPYKERAAWFTKRDNAFVLKIGRAGYDMGAGVTRFKAKDLAEVQSLLTTAKVVIEGDDTIKDKIRSDAEARKRK